MSTLAEVPWAVTSEKVEAEVQAAIETAENVVAWAETILNPPPSPPGAKSK